MHLDQWCHNSQSLLSHWPDAATAVWMHGVELTGWQLHWNALKALPHSQGQSAVSAGYSWLRLLYCQGICTEKRKNWNVKYEN